MKLDYEFVDWAIKWLNVVNEKQKETRETRYLALKKSYEDIVRKIDNLLELKISEANKGGILISDEEFAEKKESLLVEKARAQELLSKVDKYIDEWAELAAKTFDFAATAQDRFSDGDIEERKIILRAIGSHLLLKDKKLTIEARTPFFKIQQAVTEINTLERLEPNENVNNTAQSEVSQSQNIIWGGRPVSNRRPLLSQSSALTN